MHRSLFTAAVLAILPGLILAAEERPPPLRGALLTAEMASTARLNELREKGFTAVVLLIHDDSPAGRQADLEAAARTRAAQLELWLWIEVARSPELAAEHPEWMASLQGHLEWRRYFKDFPYPQPGEVVKNFPWVPILYQEAFDAHLARIKRLLATRPGSQGLFLNDLQGSPSACGCGNPVCRWAADYGPIKTATPVGDDAAVRFVAEVEKLVGSGTPVIPVWTTECEAHDVANDALCAGVGCYKGICWKAYSRQLRPLARHSSRIGALLLYKQFGQDTKSYSDTAGWVGHALRGFQNPPPASGGEAIEAQRLVAVLQGWNVSDVELASEQRQAAAAGAAGQVVAFAEIEQSWLPRIVKAR